MEFKKISRVDKWRKQYVWFNALMFILVGDNNITFKTSEQITRSANKIKKQNPVRTVEQSDKSRAKSKINITRYY